MMAARRVQVENALKVILNVFRKSSTVYSLVFGGFWFRVTALWTDGWTGGRADRPSYRDARTHLKSLQAKLGSFPM